LEGFRTTDFTDFMDGKSVGSYPCYPYHYMKKSRISDKIFLTVVASSFPSFPSVQNRYVKSVISGERGQPASLRANLLLFHLAIKKSVNGIVI